MAPVSKKNLDRKITARLPRRCPRQVERRIIADYSDFTGSSAFTATGQLATLAALVNANWCGWHAAFLCQIKAAGRLSKPLTCDGHSGRAFTDHQQGLERAPLHRSRDVARRWRASPWGRAGNAGLWPFSPPMSPDIEASW